MRGQSNAAVDTGLVWFVCVCEDILHTAQGRAFRFSLLPATTRCALPGTWRRGGGGASGENFCDQEG